MSGGGGPSSDGLATIAFLTGVDASGHLNTVTGWRWNEDTPATYGNVGSAHKWGGGAAGTAGGTVSYYFDAGSNWSAAEQTAFKSALALWSAVANITFTMVDSAAAADTVFYRQSSTTSPLPAGVTLEKAQTYLSATYTAGLPGATTLPGIQSSYMSMDTSVGCWQDITSFNVWGGYALGTVVHELGHLIGLIHAGPYNGTVATNLQQYNATDTTLWSLMSYIEPTDTAAKYYSSYPVTGTDWTLDKNYYPTTFMPLDILAAQRLYGAPATTPLNNVTFGFNCTIIGDCRPFFDFTVNTNPVITLYATGLSNTLDISNWATSSVINLNPGTFSSAGAMTNNIGIAYNTRIDTALGGAGDDLFIVNADADTIDGGSNGYDVVQFSGTYASYTASRAANNTVTVTFGSVTDTLTRIDALKFADQTVKTQDLPCLAAGSRVATLRGEVAVEALRLGELVRLADGGTAAVAWLGHRSLDCTRHPRPHDVMPVRVGAHAFGPGRPHASLLLSPDHAVFADGVLVPVRYLVNGATITQQPVSRIEYWHVELAAHDVLLAQGLPVESYLDTGNRGAFANGGGPIEAHPDFARAVWARTACARLVTAGAELEAVRSFLLEQAEALGWHLTREPAVALDVAGSPIAPHGCGEQLEFALPAGVCNATLLSRQFVPAETQPDSNDCRCLGVAVSALWLDGRAVPLDSPVFGAGWHAPEDGLRWTDGAGAIVLDGARTVAIGLRTIGRYWQASPGRARSYVAPGTSVERLVLMVPDGSVKLGPGLHSRHHLVGAPVHADRGVQFLLRLRRDPQ